MAVNPEGGSQEAIVQVAPAGGGYGIRNLIVRAMQPDGSIQQVNMQVVSIADESGQVLSFDTNVQYEILSTLRAILKELRDGL